jgi:hypothetical protein
VLPDDPSAIIVNGLSRADRIGQIGFTAKQSRFRAQFGISFPNGSEVTACHDD